MKSTAKILLFSFSMGVLFCITDAFLDVAVFGKESFYFNSLFNPSPSQISVRILIFIFFLSFGLFFAGKINRKKEIIQNLKKKYTGIRIR